MKTDPILVAAFPLILILTRGLLPGLGAGITSRHESSRRHRAHPLYDPRSMHRGLDRSSLCETTYRKQIRHEQSLLPSST